MLNGNETAINQKVTLDDAVANGFSNLSKNNEKILLKQNDEKNKGFLDRIFGSKNIEIKASFMIAISLLLVGGIVMIFGLLIEKKFNYEFWEKIFPIITLTLGYIFGKSLKI